MMYRRGESDIVSGFEDAREAWRGVMAGLSEEQLNWSAEPGTWSIAQCVDHLHRSGVLIADRLEQARGRAPSPLAGLVRGADYFFAYLMSPRFRLPMPAPRSYRPAGAVLEAARVAAGFDQLQARFIRLAEMYAGSGRSNVIIGSPASRLLYLTGRGWFETVIAHQERHLAQAWRVRNHPAFPGGSLSA